jgi:negative regulator of flagellin synthesis FlgM
MTDVKPAELNNLLVAKTHAARDAKDHRADEAQTRTRQDKSQPHQDSVELSRDARTLRKLQQRLEAQDSFDEARVEQIKSAIRDGEYPIDNKRLAEKFYELENQLNQ